MFPIIPQYYSEKMVKPKTNFDGEKKIKIFAESTVFADCVTENFSIDELFNNTEDELGEEIQVRVGTEGIIKCNLSSWTWITKINLADDCHSSNVRLCQTSSKNVFRLECIKKIQTFEELALWFSHDLLAYLQIPFLTPANIQGEKQYVCHKCGYQYEMPNPLKIHLALNCKVLQHKEELWNKLKMLNQTTATSSVNPKLSIQNINFAFQLTLQKAETNIFHRNELKRNNGSPNNNNNNLLVDDSEDSSATIIKADSSCDFRVSNISNNNDDDEVRSTSAFKPYRKYRDKAELCIVPTPYLNRQMLNSAVRSPCTISATEINLTSTKLHSSEEENFINKQAAEIETIVSNLGKIRNGHLCIYCGKMYSRKYGLKIHIRTHTGFKPLKCKYCMRPFGDPSNLNKHVRLHSEADTPYKCDQCGKILVRKRDLDRHVKSRHRCKQLQEYKISTSL